MVKLAIISDTHTLHHKIEIPDCDILIHCGDYSGRGTVIEFHDFLNWFSSLEQCKHKVFISGNHDKAIQKESSLAHVIPKHVNYLHDSGCEIEGLKLWGSPWTRFFYDWAFNGLDYPKGNLNAYYGGPGPTAEPDSDHPLLDDIYSRIPSDTNVLITHNPPYNILDTNLEGIRCGSRALIPHLNRVKPKLNCFGHLHTAAGIEVVGKTTYVNAAMLDDHYTRETRVIRKPVIIDL